MVGNTFEDAGGREFARRTWRRYLSALGVIAFLWGIGLYVKAAKVSHGLSYERAVLAFLAPAVIAFVVIAVLAMGLVGSVLISIAGSN